MNDRFDPWIGADAIVVRSLDVLEGSQIRHGLQVLRERMRVVTVGEKEASILEAE